MTFLTSSIDWFLGRRASHMGAEQYVAHGGFRAGQSTSGAALWAAAEAERYAASGNMVNAETNLLQLVAKEISQEIPTRTPVIELGPGTTTAFRNKTLPIVQAIQSRTCVLVDESTAFLRQIANEDALDKNLKIQPIVDDFFENDTAYLDEQSLVCSFGSTISNIINPINAELPRIALTQSLSKMACAARSGWLMVGFDSDQDGERIKSYFKKHALFQLNVFDRMATELPITGDFDPLEFRYRPEWIAPSGQLAHVALANRTMNFQIGTTSISLKKDQKLHIKNSYKFMPEFFEACCYAAGLEVIKSWSNGSPARIYLLKLHSRIDSLNSSLHLNQSWSDNIQAAE